MNVSGFFETYCTPSQSTHFCKPENIKSNERWAELMFDKRYINKNLLSTPFEDRAKLMRALDKIDNKLKFHERQEQFSLSVANRLLRKREFENK